MGADERKWNPRYVLYAKAYGRDPEAMRAHDDEAYPGGRMAGFMLWIQDYWREWRALKGFDRNTPLSADYAEFDAWLAARVTDALASKVEGS